MKALYHVLFPAIIVGVVILAGESRAYSQEKKIAKEELPAAVRAAFEKAYPGATIKGASTEKEHGKVFYEVESIEGSTHRDILYTPEGKVWEVEEGIPADSLPGIVLKAVMNKSHNGKIVKAERVMRENKMEYEVRVEKKHRLWEIVVDVKGKVVESKEMKEKEENEEGEESEEHEKD